MTPRACDACKARKVKCDGVHTSGTCSNCRMSNLSCSYLRDPKKRGPKPHRARSRHLSGNHQIHKSPKGDSLVSEDLNMDSPALASMGSPVVSEPTYADQHEYPIVGSRRQSHNIDLNRKICIVHENLIESVKSVLPNLTMEHIVSKCVDMYLDELLPIGPMVHGPSIRANTSLEMPLLSSGIDVLLGGGGLAPHPNTLSNLLPPLRLNTLTTAICACSAHLLTSDSSENGDRLATIFLNASRDLLSLYQDLDVQNPESSSITIRIFHAGVLHTNGQVLLAWHALDEALRLAQRMRLWDESTYEGLDTLEAYFRRLAFWQLYIMDSYAAIFEGRPKTLHEFSIDSAITTVCPDGSMGSTEIFQAETVQLLGAFYVNQQLWLHVSRVLLELQTLTRFCQSVGTTDIVTQARKMNLTRTYLEFLGVLDANPQFLQTSEIRVAIAESTTILRERKHLWVQRTNILITFHCLKTILVQKFADLGLASLLGLSDENDMLALRKTEIAQDLVSVITNFPFDALRANGEACVMKIRLVGATLLQVIQQCEAPHIVTRARVLFTPLLDLLSKLDSKVSNELNKDYLP